ncbi:mucin-2-like [Ostrea edulis]|uniref:mucin-2-like n=1 Tax=Ostrea edulis TaxID=37623 RepID=UPI0024AF1C4D|nr:mucin-2-like [Ostrea edulis]
MSKKIWYELMKSVKVALLMEIPANPPSHGQFSSCDFFIKWKMEGRTTACVICAAIVMMTLQDFYTFAKIMDVAQCPRCLNKRGVVTCKTYKNNCVSVFLNRARTQIREIRVPMCTIDIVVNRKWESLTDFPVVRDIRGHQCASVFNMPTEESKMLATTTIPSASSANTQGRAWIGPASLKSTTQDMPTEESKMLAIFTVPSTSSANTQGRAWIGPASLKSKTRDMPTEESKMLATSTIPSTSSARTQGRAWIRPASLKSTTQDMPTEESKMLVIFTVPSTSANTQGRAWIGPASLKSKTRDMPTEESKMLATSTIPSTSSARTQGRAWIGPASLKSTTRGLQLSTEEFDVPGTAGVFAWAVVTTLAIILIVIRHLLLSKIKCCCRRQVNHLPRTPSPPSTPCTRETVEQIRMHLLHTPSFIATTPSSLSASTPNTVVSVTRPLLGDNDDEPISQRTRAKSVAKRLSL